MKNFTIPPFKHPDPDQNKIQESEIICYQCGFRCESELLLNHHIAKKLMKLELIPPLYSVIYPNKKNFKGSYCESKFIG